MKLLRQPNKWSCLPTAFAMAMDVSLESLLERIGHNGSEICWPNLPDPLCRRSFHEQELFYAADYFGWLVTPFHSICYSTPMLTVKPYQLNFHGHIPAMHTPRGVLVISRPEKARHAVAYYEGKILDPDSWGEIELGKGVNIHTFYRLIKSK